jgi:hypothetical protein
MVVPHYGTSYHWKRKKYIAPSILNTEFIEHFCWKPQGKRPLWKGKDGKTILKWILEN